MQALTIAMAAFSALGEIQQGRAEAEAMRREAEASRIEAGIARENAEQSRLDAVARREQQIADRELREQDAKRLMATQRARAAGGGLALSGSPLLLLSETASDLERDLGLLDVQATRDIDRFLSEARSFDAQGTGLLRSADSLSRSAGRASSGGFLRGGAKLIGGVVRSGVIK